METPTVQPVNVPVNAIKTCCRPFFNIFVLIFQRKKIRIDESQEILINSEVKKILTSIYEKKIPRKSGVL